VRLGGAIRRVLDRHDLLFSAGADLFTLSLPPEIEPVPPGLTIVHLDTDPWQLGKNFPTASALLGDPLTTLPALTAALGARLDAAGAARRDARRAATEAAIAADFAALDARATAEAGRSPVSPLALMQAVGRHLPENAVVVDETISSGAGLFQFLRRAAPGSLFGMRGGGIGWGLPAAVGVQLGLPDRRVVALVGDGSAMYSIQALWTAAHEKVPVVFVIINNKSYRILKQRAAASRGVAAQTGRYVGMELSEPAISFTGLAAAMGVPAVAVSTIADFVEALKLGLASDHPLLIEVAADPDFRG
jgi:benzoylformate decarboxylase